MDMNAIWILSVKSRASLGESARVFSTSIMCTQSVPGVLYLAPQ
ncbi:MAG: hypothetical protein KatS3mg015_2465 [Fimbriimonadales bacterium]|nr:MAG: hypothetical protein KatS3mg015_2465 [Fimbriimonadales bacterium]